MIGQFEVDSANEGDEPIVNRNFEVSLPTCCDVSVSVDNYLLKNVPKAVTDGRLSIPVPSGAEGRTLRVSAMTGGDVGGASWIIRPEDNFLGPTEVFEKLTSDLKQPNAANLKRFSRSRIWSYGDVENNGVYYHPNLTHYSHQVFEEFFKERVGINYVDLSRDTDNSRKARDAYNIPRMTFPVRWLYQSMTEVMEAGDAFDICLDTVDLDPKRIGVRAWVLNQSGSVAAVVIWLRHALLLPDRKPVDIPSWFPRLPRGTFP